MCDKEDTRQGRVRARTAAHGRRDTRELWKIGGTGMPAPSTDGWAYLLMPLFHLRQVAEGRGGLVKLQDVTRELRMGALLHVVTKACSRGPRPARRAGGGQRCGFICKGRLGDLIAPKPEALVRWRHERRIFCLYVRDEALRFRLAERTSEPLQTDLYIGLRPRKYVKTG